MALKSQFNLPAEAVAELITAISTESAIARASKKIPLSGNGSIIHSIGEIEAHWQNGETGLKQTSATPVNSITVDAYVNYALFPVSNVLIEDGGENVFDALKDGGVKGLTKNFDGSGTGGRPTPGENFSSLAGAETFLVDGYTSLVNAFGASADANGALPTAILADTRLIYGFQGLVGTDGRPLLDLSNGTLLNIPVYGFRANPSTHPAAYVGDFANRSVWGQVGDVSVATNEGATIDGVSMFQTNQTAVRIETRMAFAVADLADFKRIVLTADPAPVAG